MTRGGLRKGGEHGRPRLPADERRSERVLVCLTPGELAALDAEVSGGRAGEFDSRSHAIRYAIFSTFYMSRGRR